MVSPATRQELQDAIAPLATKQELQDAIAPLATKQELREAIEPLATKQELREAIAAAVAPLATKQELEMWGGALSSRIDALQARFDQRFQTLLDELARHIRAAQEETRTWIATLDDKYRDLPERVTRLESDR